MKRKNIFKKWWFYAIILLIIFLLSGPIISNRNTETPPQTSSVTKKTFEKTLSDSGKIEPIDLRKLGANGKIISLSISPNSSVEAGQILAQIESNGRTLDLASPIKGTVLSIQGNVGETLQTNEFIVVADTSNFKTQISVGERDILSVAIGQEAKIRFRSLNDDKDYLGKVSQISAINNSQNTASIYKVQITLNESNSKLRTGMSANTKLTIANKENSLVIPSNSVFTLSDTKYAKLLEWQDKSAGRFTLRNIKITTGLENDTETEVLSGLSEGEEVVPSDTIVSAPRRGFLPTPPRN
jgi:multidrug efflux pump subunit AcrA (membrane-fusion protein)